VISDLHDNAFSFWGRHFHLRITVTAVTAHQNATREGEGLSLRYECSANIENIWFMLFLAGCDSLTLNSQLSENNRGANLTPRNASPGSAISPSFTVGQ
jgi:hypothetical protein